MATAHPVITVAGRKIAVDLPHLAFATAIAAWSVWFCHDAWRSGANVENMILILPAGLAAAILYLFVAASCFRRVGDTAEIAAPRAPLAKGIGLKIAGSMGLLAAYVVAGPLIGFDIASFFYMLAMLAFLGERRPLVLLIAPLLFCAVVVLGFNKVLATPLPMFFIHEAG